MTTLYLLYLIFEADEMKWVTRFVPNYKDATRIDGTTKYIIPYALTISKKHKKEFLKYRDKKKYKITKRKIDDDQIDEILSDSDFNVNGMDIIDADFKVSDSDKKISIYTTLNEYVSCQESFSENLYDYMDIIFDKKREDYLDYSLLKKKYIKCLDGIGYTTYYDYYIGGDDKFEFPSGIEQRQEDAVECVNENVSIFYATDLPHFTDEGGVDALFEFFHFAM